LNGNTLLNKFVDQYNFNGFEKLIKLLPNIWTYKNNKNQDCKEYILSNISLIGENYDQERLNSKFEEYAEILKNYINSNDLSKFYSNDINSKLITDLINNCIEKFSAYLKKELKKDEESTEQFEILKLFTNKYNNMSENTLETFKNIENITGMKNNSASPSDNWFIEFKDNIVFKSRKIKYGFLKLFINLCIHNCINYS
jgi:hypothetical protein